MYSDTVYLNYLMCVKILMCMYSILYENFTHFIFKNYKPTRFIEEVIDLLSELNQTTINKTPERIPHTHADMVDELSTTVLATSLLADVLGVGVDSMSPDLVASAFVDVLSTTLVVSLRTVVLGVVEGVTFLNRHSPVQAKGGNTSPGFGPPFIIRVDCRGNFVLLLGRCCARRMLTLVNADTGTWDEGEGEGEAEG